MAEKKTTTTVGSHLPTRFTDPLENAKLGTEPVVDNTELKPLPKDLTAAPPEPVKAAEPEPPKAETPKAPAKRLKPVVVTKYRVLEDKMVSFSGNMTTIRRGDVVSIESYGPDGMKRIFDSGAKLEEITAETSGS